MKPVTPPLLAAAALLAISGCGLTGDLQRPPPLFGEPAERAEGRLPDRSVEEGLGVVDVEADETDATAETPEAEDELLGGPE